MFDLLVQIVQLIASVATIITVGFLIIQIRLQNKTTVDQIESTKNQIYTSFVEDCLKLDQLMIQYPECRKYNLEPGDKQIVYEITDELLKNRVLSIEELIIDSLENVCTYLDFIPENQRVTWIDYIESMRLTPAFKYYTEDYNPDWYSNSNAVKMKFH